MLIPTRSPNPKPNTPSKSPSVRVVNPSDILPSSSSATPSEQHAATSSSSSTSGGGNLRLRLDLNRDVEVGLKERDGRDLRLAVL